MKIIFLFDEKNIKSCNCIIGYTNSKVKSIEMVKNDRVQGRYKNLWK
jgi:hypothetical protein